MKILGEELGEIRPVVHRLAAAAADRVPHRPVLSRSCRPDAAQYGQRALRDARSAATGPERVRAPDHRLPNPAQRGYLLTGESSYLQPYTDAVTRKSEPALDHLHEAYGGEDGSSEFHELRILTGKKLGELEDAVALYKKRGIAPALNVVRTDVGKRTMDEITRNRRHDAARRRPARPSAAKAHWQEDFRLSRWVSAAGAIFNIGLVLLAIRLVYSDMRRRARQADRPARSEAGTGTAGRSADPRTDRALDAFAGRVRAGKVRSVARAAR